MLDLLRRKAQSPYIQATILIIIIVFVFWGVGTNQGGRRNAVAVVNDTPITFEEYRQAYNRMISRYKEQFGDSLPDNLIESLGIKQQTLNQLIQRILVQQGAQDMGLAVSDTEVRDSIQKIESFRTNGMFDVDTYREILKASRMGVSDFEASVRSDLLTTKVLASLGRFARVSPVTMEDRFAYDYEEVKLEYVASHAADYEKKVEPDDEAVKAFFAEKKDAYKTEPQIKLKYVSFPFATEDLQLSEEEVEEYYQRNLAQYSRPERRHARHILIKTAVEDDEKKLAEKKKQAEEILKKAQEGADFAELAKKYSEDSSAGRGGDLGFFSRGRMIKPFEDTTFSLKEGEISQVVKTRFGFHIIKVEKIEPGKTPTLDEIRTRVETALKKEKGRSLAFGKASQAYEKIILSGSMEKYAESGEAVISETGFFQRQSPPDDGPLTDPAFLDIAFSLKKGELSSIVESAAHYSVMFVDDIKAPEVPALEKVRDRVEKDFIAERAKEMARENAEKMLTALKGGADFSELVKENAVSVKESDFFSRSKRYGKDVPAPVIENGFGLSADNPYPEKIETDGKNFFVFRFKEKRAPAEDLLAKEREGFKSRLQEEAKSALFAAWVDHLRTKAEITTNEELL